MHNITLMHKRFRGFLPVVVDIETAGFNAKTDAILEIALVTLRLDAEAILQPEETHFFHVEPFMNANIDVKSIEFNKIDPFHPFRFAQSEQEVLRQVNEKIQLALKATKCNRAVLVGHNPAFDLSFLQAAERRYNLQNSLFHPFTTFDTASLAGVALGQTVLARACQAAGIEFDTKEAHSAKYDAEKTAQLFCYIVNHWQAKIAK